MYFKFFDTIACLLMYMACLSFLSCHSLDKTPTIERLGGSTIASDSLTAYIDKLIQDAQVHGLAVTAYNNDQIVYQEAFGYKDYPDQLQLLDTTSIYGASLSKAVFAVLVMKLVEEGVIDLDTPLESYLPRKIYEYEPQTKWHDDFSALAKDSLYHKITARMCLAHTSGFPNWRWFEPDQQLRVKFEPGSRYSYSGEGFVYLQVVLEKLTGKGLEEMAQEYLFQPLGMRRSSYKWQPAFKSDFAHGHTKEGETYQRDTDNEPRAGSTLETTARDYSRFLEAVMGEELLSAESWQTIFTPQIRIRSIRQFGPLSLRDSTANDDIQLSYGLGWGLLQTPYGTAAFKEGNGDGCQHYTILFPDTGYGLMLLTNSDNGQGIFQDLSEVTIGNTFTPWEWQGYTPYYEL